MLKSFLLSCIRLCRISTSVPHWLGCVDLLLMEEGIGLLIPNGILTVERALFLHLVFSLSCLPIYHRGLPVVRTMVEDPAGKGPSLQDLIGVGRSFVR